MIKSLEKYIEETYYKELCDSLNKYYYDNSTIIDLHTFRVPYPTYAELESVSVNKIKFKDDIYSYLSEFKLEVSAKFSIRNNEQDDYCEDTKIRKFYLTCRVVLDDGFKFFKVVKVSANANDMYIYENSLTNLLLPFMETKDFELRANEFLKKYYPEALESPMKIEPSILINRMRINMYHAPLNSGIFGKTLFTESTELIYNDDNEKERMTLKKHSILINPNICFDRNIGSYNYTIIHECIHVEYHSKFFEINKIIDKKYNSISCKDQNILNKPTSSYQKAIDIMEWQASNLASRILMPYEMIKIKFYELWKSYSDEFRYQKAKMMQFIVTELSRFFGVSKQAVIIRLFDIGITNAVGVSNYDNDSKELPYYFRNDVLTKNQTFKINFNDFIKALSESDNLRDLFFQHKILYVNGMVVLNNEKYVRKNSNNKLVLTDYALNNIDECAFIFEKNKIKSKSEYKEYLTSINFLCRNENKNSYVSANYNSNSNINLENRARNPIDDLDDIAEALEMVKKMNGTVAEDLKTFAISVGYMKADGKVDYTMIGKQTRIDPHTIKSYVEGNTTPQKNKALAICAGLEFHPRVAHHFLKKCGYCITGTCDIFDYVYCYLIEQHYEDGIDVWNDYILKMDNVKKGKYTIPNPS